MVLINRGHLGLFTEARQIKRFPILPTTLGLQLMMALVRVYHGSDVWIGTLIWSPFRITAVNEIQRLIDMNILEG